jgi:hypothetical protein
MGLFFVFKVVMKKASLLFMLARERDGIVDRGKSIRRNELVLLFVCVYVAVDWLFVPVLV